MAKDIISAEGGSLSFGDRTLAEKTKKDGFEYDGDIYKVKTYSAITKLEKNEMFIYESVPGTDVADFAADAEGVTFTVSGSQETQITLGLGDDAEYDIIIDGETLDSVETSMGGKLAMVVDLSDGPVKVGVRRR